MITSFENSYLQDVYKLGSLLHENYRNLYDETSLNSDVNKVFMCVDNSNKLIGFIHIQNLIDEIDIIDIIIDSSYRKLGYASKLLNYVIDYAKNKRIILEVNQDNLPAINLYKKHGFSEINRRKGYYNGVDAIVMEKK